MDATTGRQAQPSRPIVIFGEEIPLDPPLVELLTEVENELKSLAARYGPAMPASERLELLESALDEIESALERVRGARSTLGRIELRLAAAFHRALDGLRELEHDTGSGAASSAGGPGRRARQALRLPPPRAT